MFAYTQKYYSKNLVKLCNKHTSTNVHLGQNTINSVKYVERGTLLYHKLVKSIIFRFKLENIRHQTFTKKQILQNMYTNDLPTFSMNVYNLKVI